MITSAGVPQPFSRPTTTVRWHAPSSGSPSHATHRCHDFSPALASGQDTCRLPDISLEGDLMVFGHVAAVLVAKKAAPRVSLGVLLVAAEALDILWGVFLLTGVKRLLPSVSPWSHGLLMAAVWLPLACTAIGVPECSLDWSCSATGSWMSSLIPFGRQSNLTCCWSVGRRGWAWVYGSHVAEGSQAGP